MKACAIFEEHKKEEILKPLREQLQTEAMEQSRLRKIQDSAAGRKPNKVKDAYLWSADKQGHWHPNDSPQGKMIQLKDGVEHTKEYFDRNRNRAMEGEDFHLEPLPINTFK